MRSISSSPSTVTWYCSSSRCSRVGLTSVSPVNAIWKSSSAAPDAAIDASRSRIGATGIAVPRVLLHVAIPTARKQVAMPRSSKPSREQNAAGDTHIR